MDTGIVRLERVLRGLGYTVDVDAVVVAGQPRLDLLAELFARWQRWGAQSGRGAQGWAALDPPSPSATAESQVWSLVRCAAALGLCDPDDSGAVMGTGPPGQSLALLLVTAEMVATQERNPGTQQTTTADQDATLTLLELVAREDLGSVFSPSCSLLPPDMMAALATTPAADSVPLSQYQAEIAAFEAQVGTCMFSTLPFSHTSLDPPCPCTPFSILKVAEHRLRSFFGGSMVFVSAPGFSDGRVVFSRCRRHHRAPPTRSPGTASPPQIIQPRENINSSLPQCISRRWRSRLTTSFACA